MNKQQLAAKIWASANKMRSKIEANEYKDYILGFIFYKYLSEKEETFLRDNDFDDEDIKEVTEEDEETVEFIRNNLGYFISYSDLFSTWLSLGSDFDVSDVRDALSAFSRHISPTHKKVFEGIFDILHMGLGKLGETAGKQTKAISDVFELIKDIPMDGKQGYDVLGYIYEFLIEKFAANAGKKAGEFYTPHEVSLLMSEIVAEHLKDREHIEIYDPTSGSGSLLINIGKSVEKHISNGDNIKYYAQELKRNTYNLTRMNLVMRGISPSNIVTRNGDTLEDDWPYFDEEDKTVSYHPLYVDAVVSNPPYSQPWDPSGKENDPRYARFGLAPKGKADFAFLLHDLYHIKPDGIMTIVLPHGVLFRGGEEGEIRKNLIEYNHIDTIIGLPANIFYGTGIPTIIMVLKQKRERDDVLIIDASKGFIKEGTNNRLRASDIRRISDTIVNREDVEKYAKVVSKDEIRANDYNLNIPRYVDSSEAAENWDLYASMYGGIPLAELQELDRYWKAYPGLKESLFTMENPAYAELRVKNVKESIEEHADIQAFHEHFKQAFGNFRGLLIEELIENVDNVEISKEEERMTKEIFSKFQDIPLVDAYDAYQLLHDEWEKISVDLEMIQTEGKSAITKVDPNMVIKKKDNKEQEIQDGWVGHIIPFELIQDTLLKAQSEALKQKESRLSEIPGEYESILEELTDEEKETSVLNDDNSAFVMKEVPKKIKELKTEAQNEDIKTFIDKLKRVESLNKEEKDLKSQIKKEKAELVNLTKQTIENLTEEESKALLEQKWIDTLIHNLYTLSDKVVSDLISKVEALKSKYATTYKDLETEIKETEAALCSMIDELTGDEFDMKGLSELKALLMGN